jgi:hypothetical protein
MRAMASTCAGSSLGSARVVCGGAANTRSAHTHARTGARARECGRTGATPRRATRTRICAMMASVSSAYTSSSDLPPKPRKALACACSNAATRRARVSARSPGCVARACAQPCTAQRRAVRGVTRLAREQPRAQHRGDAGERNLSARDGRLRAANSERGAAQKKARAKAQGWRVAGEPAQSRRRQRSASRPAAWVRRVPRCGPAAAARRQAGEPAHRHRLWRALRDGGDALRRAAARGAARGAREAGGCGGLERVHRRG